MTTATSPLIASTTAASAPPATSARDKLTGVAKQFEAIFLRQMLSAARKTNFDGENGLFSGQGMDTFTQMQDERFADIASQTGAFGLGKMIESHLARLLPADPAQSEKGSGNGV